MRISGCPWLLRKALLGKVSSIVFIDTSELVDHYWISDELRIFPNVWDNFTEFLVVGQKKLQQGYPGEGN